MASGSETPELKDSAEGLTSEAKEAAEEHIGMYPVDSHGLVVGDVGYELQREAEAEAMIMPVGNIEGGKKIEYASKTRIYNKFEENFKKRLRNDDWVRAKRMQVKDKGIESLEEPVRKLFLEKMGRMELEAWEDVKSELRVPKEIEERMAGILHGQNLRVKATFRQEGIDAESLLVKGEAGKKIKLLSPDKRERAYKNAFTLGTEEGIRRRVKKQTKVQTDEVPGKVVNIDEAKNEAALANEDEPTEKAA